MYHIHCLMKLDEADLNELLTTELTEDERIDVAAIRILKGQHGAFIEPAKGSEFRLCSAMK